MTSPANPRPQLPAWVVPVTGLVIAGVLVALLLTLNSSPSAQSAATQTARNFVAAVNTHDTNTAQSLACNDYSDAAKRLSDEVNAAKAHLSVEQVRKVGSEQQALVRTTVTTPSLPGQLVLTVQKLQGLWLVCGQSAG